MQSTQEGARVSVDGRDAGTTPATVQRGGPWVTHPSRDARRIRDGGAQSGDHGGASYTQTVTVTLARPPAAAQAVAPAAARGGVSARRSSPGGLTVDSRPEGASVFVDGKMVGTTPLAIDSVAAGEHAIGLTREGYSRWASSVRVTPGKQRE